MIQMHKAFVRMRFAVLDRRKMQMLHFGGEMRMLLKFSLFSRSILFETTRGGLQFQFKMRCIPPFF